MTESSRPALLTSLGFVALGALAAYGVYRLLRSVTADDDRAPAPAPAPQSLTRTADEVRRDAIDHERRSPGSVDGVAESAAPA